MPRVTTIQTNFTAGELSPRLLGRVDIEKYRNGAVEMYNAYPLVHGGARRRAGTRYTAGAKNNDKPARLVPFIRSRTLAFMLEFGETYIRFFTGTGQVESSPGVPYEVATPWDDAELKDVHYVQGADTMFLAHPSYPMRKLVRFTNTNWKLSTVVWEVPPSEEIGERPNTTLTLSAVSGVGVTATAGAASFLASHVGRYIESLAGLALITAFTSTTVVTVTILATDAFASVGPIAANNWKVLEAPKTTLTPSGSAALGGASTLTLAANGWQNNAQVSHIGMFVEINGGLVEITGVTSATIATGVVRAAMTGLTAAQQGAWALRQVVWNSLDGYPRAVTLHEQRLIAGGSTTYPATVWGSRSGEYLNFAEGLNDADAVSFALASDQVNPIEHLASTRVLLPLTYGGEFSMNGGIEKPITPTNVQARLQTAYGAEYTRPVRVANEVIYIQRGGKKVRGLGYRVETDAFSAPDLTILAEHITGDGITEMAYAQEPDQVVWMVRADGFLVSMSIDREQNAVGFGRHQTDGRFESLGCMPYNNTDQLWAVVVRTIGGVTKRYIERFEEGLQTDCAITGAVTENAVTGAVWAAGVLTVTRAGHGYADGSTVRLSGFTAANDVSADEEAGIEADPAVNGEYDITVIDPNTYTVEIPDDPGAISVLGTDAQATTAWAGGAHLNGKTCDIVADGYVAAPKVMTAGAVTLDIPAYSVEIGLHYNTRIQTLPPEIATGQGSAQGNAISVHEVVLRLYKTKGGKVNGQPLLTRKTGTGAVLNQPVPEFTGDKRVEKLGWGKTGGGDYDGSILIEQDQPLPLQALAVISRCTVNDG